MGGSLVSLREVVVDAIRFGHHCTVCCPNDTVAGYYRSVGASTIVTPVIRFHHNTLLFYRLNPLGLMRMAYALLRTVISFFKMRSHVKALQPDIVHLNSATLVLYLLLFRWLNYPAIFHVRENIVDGYFGLRKRLIGYIAETFSSVTIYISEYERDLLGTSPQKSVVIYNYVHEKEFMADAAGGRVTDAAFTLVSLGGLFEIKGGKTLLQSLQFVNDVQLLMVGSSDPRIDARELELNNGKEYLDDIIALLNNPAIVSKVKFQGKVDNPAYYISASDVLIFWANAPHFPRPVFEAWLLEKPVIYYNPEFKNELINDSTVLFVHNKSSEALAQAVEAIRTSGLMSPDKKRELRELSREHFTEKNFEKINGLYLSLS